MNVTTFQDSAIKLQKLFKVVPSKGTLVQYRRQLDYGIFGGSAVLEGAVGQEETSNYVSAVVPMAYYVHIRRSTLQAQMVETFDGVKAEDRIEADAALKIAADIEFHLFRGKAMYSNGGVFDGNPLAMNQEEPGMHGLDPQIRISDSDLNTQDLMFNEYGSDASIAINQGGVLAQTTIEDVYAKSQMNHGQIEKVYLDPLTHSAYNKISFNKERIVLAGSPQAATGASLKEQFVADGAIALSSSRFLSAKTSAARTRSGTPGSPAYSTSQSSNSTTFANGEVYQYSVTAVNDIGESVMSAVTPVTIAGAGNQINMAITPASGTSARSFNVYRSEAGSTAKAFIGRVKNSGAATTTFTDLNNRLPFAITCFGLDLRGIEMPELSKYSSKDLAESDLTKPKAFFRFVCVIAKLPRFNILIDNVKY